LEFFKLLPTQGDRDAYASLIQEPVAELTAWGLGFDSAGDLYVTDPLNNAIRLLKPSGQ
jgi:hypothetical protein